MSDDSAPKDPTNPYGAAPGREGDSATPHADAPQWSSATQRREHAGGPWPQPDRPQSGGYPTPVRRDSGAGSAFVIALLATALTMAAGLAASYASYKSRIGSRVWRENLSEAGLAAWPREGYFKTSTFATAFVVAAVLLLLLVWLVVASAPGGRAAFAVAIAGWGATILAGAVASLLAYLVQSGRRGSAEFVTGAINLGAAWGLRVGWIVALVALLGQVTRHSRR